MSVKIENLTNRPVLVRLNSGETLHLPPKGVSTALMDAEVENNARVRKLQERQAIALQPVAGPKPTSAAAPKKEKPKSTVKK